MRTAFLPSCGDPFLALLTIRCFRKYWYDEVDRVYINYNNNLGIPDEVLTEFFSKIIDPKIHLIYHPKGIEHGQALKEMTLLSNEDDVMFIEEDAYIFTPGVVDRCFNLLKEYDIVGSPRGSCGVEIWNRSQEKYGLDYSGYGDMGPNWWPNFFFIKRKNLLKTDLNFGSKCFNAGDYCKELDYTFKEVNNGDTFVWASIQLRAMGLTSISVPQHKASPNEMKDREDKMMNFHPSQQPFEWIHAGSLSSGWNGYLKDAPLPEMTDDQKADFESRCAWWSIASDAEGFTDFKKEYKEGIESLIERAGLVRARIDQKINFYKGLL